VLDKGHGGLQRLMFIDGTPPRTRKQHWNTVAGIDISTESVAEDQRDKLFDTNSLQYFTANQKITGMHTAFALFED
jgi:hypothetical protein